jgi:hypothetical protein
LGGDKVFGPQVDLEPLQGKIVHGGKLDGNQEESKKEETLTAAKRISQALEFQPASREKHLLRGFSISACVGGPNFVGTNALRDVAERSSAPP